MTTRTKKKRHIDVPLNGTEPHDSLEASRRYNQVIDDLTDELEAWHKTRPTATILKFPSRRPKRAAKRIAP